MSVYAMIHDDICWCAEENCPVINCMRNTVNMMDRSGLHSYALFKGTDMCPISEQLDKCFDGCVHARECFAGYDTPEEAMDALTSEYCDGCVFAEVRED